MSVEPGGIGLFSDIFLFSLCLIFTGVLIFILIYFIITLSDLECDYLNAEECCGKLNFVSTNFLIKIPHLKITNMYYGNEATNITYFSVEHAKIMDAVFHRSNVSIMWAMDSLSNQSSNLHFSRQKVSKKNFPNMLKMFCK